MARLTLNRLLETSKFLATDAGQELNDFIVYVSDLASQTMSALRNGLTFADNMNCLVKTLTLTSGVSQIVDTGGKTPIGVMTMTGGSLEWVLDKDGKLTVTNWFQSLGQGGAAGEVRQFAGETAPAGFAICDGSALDRTRYAALFSVIGTTYGSGDGSTTFNLPDLREACVVGIGTRLSGSANADTYTLGQFKDDQFQTHLHTTSLNAGSALAAHTHTTFRSSGLAPGSTFLIGDASSGSTLGTTGTANGGVAHEHTISAPSTGRTGTTTRGKRLGMNHIICLGTASTSTTSKSVTLVILFN